MFLIIGQLDIFKYFKMKTWLTFHIELTIISAKDLVTFSESIDHSD